MSNQNTKKKEKAKNNKISSKKMAPNLLNRGPVRRSGRKEEESQKK